MRATPRHFEDGSGTLTDHLVTYLSGGRLATSGGRFRANATSSFVIAYPPGGELMNDQYGEIEVATCGASGEVGVGVSVNASAKLYFLQAIASDSKLHLFYFDGSTSTNLLTAVTPPGPAVGSTPYTLRIERRADTLYTYQNNLAAFPPFQISPVNVSVGQPCLTIWTTASVANAEIEWWEGGPLLGSGVPDRCSGSGAGGPAANDAQPYLPASFRAMRR